MYAGWHDLPQNDLLRTGENAGKQKLVVSWIVKVCKGGGKCLGERKKRPKGAMRIGSAVHYSVRRRSLGDRKDESSIWMTPGQEQQGLK